MGGMAIALGYSVLSFAADGSAAVWPVDPMEAAVARMGRPLDSWERTQYLDEE